MPLLKPELNAELMRAQVYKSFYPEKCKFTDSIGFELEIWPFRQNEFGDNGLIPHFNDAGTGLIQMLQKYAEKQTGLKYIKGPDGSSRFAYDNGGQLTFEPGGQLEYSSPPWDSLCDSIRDLNQVIESLRCFFKGEGVWFFQSGLNPWHGLEEAKLLLKKDRYLNMDRFFQGIGPYGQRMMRLSTSLQINLDLGCKDLMQRRWLAANLLAPIFMATFANSPFLEGRPTGKYSYRSYIWQHLDKTRTGFPPGLLETNYSGDPVEIYYRFALDAFSFMLPDHMGRKVFDGTYKSFREWSEIGHNGFFPSLEDWNEHLTTLFPDVRVKGFLEIRYLDAQSQVWCAVPGLLLIFLLYNESACNEVIRLLSSYRTTLPGMSEVATEKGLSEPELANLADKIFQLALKSVPKDINPHVYSLCESFYARYTHRARMPASDLLELNNGKIFTPEQYRDFERRQVDAVGSILQTICKGK